ncbi:hypothetical protein VB776_16255 [Arcicella sp. DC2W]|uniref:CopG-like ribbon-helix-helix domain-containing protein n=1 Tax=Arcicella gelida TaxID=2984195 RepID=A0ABU5S809_9BACT|nr:hypothetical protein [Arcicella sp. DC2W]MEA5404486.1 hypothetical protein [Arcicella sp. DC2W]
MSEKKVKTTQNYPLQIPFELLDKFKEKSEQTGIKLSELMVTALADSFKTIQVSNLEQQPETQLEKSFIFEQTPNA